MFEKETNEFEDGKVCEIVQDGYTFHDRLLRPVLVGVAKKSNENNNDKKLKMMKIQKMKKKLMNFKEYSFLDKSILIKFPDDWIVKEQDDNLIKVSFPFGPYPTLDCYFSCFDNPKINTNDKIRQYLLNGIEAGKEVENILDNVYVLNINLNQREITYY